MSLCFNYGDFMQKSRLSLNKAPDFVNKVANFLN
jgi:hypothetical protein